MKKRYLILLMLFASLGYTVYGQEQDTVKYGNIVINSDSIEVQVEIPSLGINNPKTNNALIIEFIPSAKSLGETMPEVNLLRKIFIILSQL